MSNIADAAASWRRRALNDLRKLFQPRSQSLIYHARIGSTAMRRLVPFASVTGFIRPGEYYEIFGFIDGG
jgi:hypothetical protein